MTGWGPTQNDRVYTFPQKNPVANGRRGLIFECYKKLYYPKETCRNAKPGQVPVKNHQDSWCSRIRAPSRTRKLSTTAGRNPSLIRARKGRAPRISGSVIRAV